MSTLQKCVGCLVLVLNLCVLLALAETVHAYRSGLPVTGYMCVVLTLAAAEHLVMLVGAVQLWRHLPHLVELRQADVVNVGLREQVLTLERAARNASLPGVQDSKVKAARRVQTTAGSPVRTAPAVLAGI